MYQDQVTTDFLSRILFDSVTVIFLLGFLLYVIFAFIALRQVDIMRKTLHTPLSGTVFMLGIGHLLLAISVLIFAYSYLV